MAAQHAVEGTPARPRLVIFRSDKHIYAQLVDDVAGKTLLTVSSQKAEGTKTERAAEVAERFGFYERFRDQVVMVTGAGGGIGSAIALKSGKASVVQGLFPLVFVILFLSTAFFPEQLGPSEHVRRGGGEERQDVEAHGGQVDVSTAGAQHLPALEPAHPRDHGVAGDPECGRHLPDLRPGVPQEVQQQPDVDGVQCGHGGLPVSGPPPTFDQRDQFRKHLGGAGLSLRQTA